MNKNFKILNEKSFILNQTLPFYVIFFVELWERFGYYSLQSILAIYLIKFLKLTEYEAISIFSSFSAIVYGFISIGGWLGDKILGTKKTIILGSIILSLGYLIITLFYYNISFIYVGMSFVAVGNGLFKSNPSSLVANMYKNNKGDLDSAFTIYYMAINIGSFFSTLLTPYIAYKFGWNIAFSISFIGLLITLLNFLYFYKSFKNLGSEADFNNLSFKKLLLILILTIKLISISYFLIKYYFLTKFMLILMLTIIIIKLFFNTINVFNNTRKLLIISYILIFESMLFFIFYGLMPTTLNLFTINHVNNKMLGINFNLEQFQALNPMWIIILSPLFTLFYTTLGKNIKIYYKFVLGMLMCSISFLILSLGIIFHDVNYNISSYWLLLSYLFQSSGELLISGLGLSMIAKLVPSNLMGFMMGFWFLINSFSAILSGNLANIISSNKKIIENRYDSIFKYYKFFMNIGLFSIIITIIMLFIAFKINNFLKNKNIEII